MRVSSPNAYYVASKVTRNDTLHTIPHFYAAASEGVTGAFDDPTDDPRFFRGTFHNRVVHLGHRLGSAVLGNHSNPHRKQVRYFMSATLPSWIRVSSEIVRVVWL